MAKVPAVWYVRFVCVCVCVGGGGGGANDVGTCCVVCTLCEGLG